MGKTYSGYPEETFPLIFFCAVLGYCAILFLDKVALSSNEALENTLHSHHHGHEEIEDEESHHHHHHEETHLLKKHDTLNIEASNQGVKADYNTFGTPWILYWANSL